MAAKPNKKTPRKVPANQGNPIPPGASPFSGHIPPPEHRFKPGQSGNPSGRPNAGLSVREWWNQMQDWPADKVRSVMDDPAAPVNKRAAARTWFDACSTDRNASGMPIAGNELDRICDRTEGKPRQGVEVTGRDGGPMETKQTVRIVTDIEKCGREFDEFTKQRMGEPVLQENRN